MPGSCTAFRARLRIPLVEDRIEVVVVTLECSGFFEAPMSPFFHGQTPVGTDSRRDSIDTDRGDGHSPRPPNAFRFVSIVFMFYHR